LGLAFQLLLAERRQGHAEKADAFCDREQWLEQRVAKLLDFGSRRQERLTGPASRDLLEIGIFHFFGWSYPAFADAQQKITESQIGKGVPPNGIDPNHPAHELL
jgi:hypothetical protein